MAEFSWEFDTPSGTYKNHAISEKLFTAAVEKSVMFDHVQIVQGFGRKQGEDVTLVRIRNITEPTDGRLTESERIPEDDFALSTVQIKVAEFGRAVPYTSLAQDLGKFDIDNPIQNALRRQMKLVLDTNIAEAYKQAKFKYIPTGLASATIDSNGIASTPATANLNVFHVEQIRDQLFDTMGAEGVNGTDEYIGIFRSLGLRGIKRDPVWEEWHKYTDPQAKFNGEVGMIEGVRFIETNHGGSTDIDSQVITTGGAFNKVGTNAVLGEGVIFGADSVAFAEVLTPELRAAMPKDFGRAKAVAWYGIFESGIIWDTSNRGEAKIVHVTSS